MASTIIIKNGTSGAPSSLSQGEIAISTSTGKLFYGSTGGTAVSSSFTFTDVTASGNIEITGNVKGNRIYENGSLLSAVYSPVAGSENIEAVGALGVGSIAAGFGNIDNGTSGIRSNNITAETSFVPDANDGATLGTTDLQFSDLFLAEGGVINFDNGDVTITQTGNDLAIAGTANTSFVGHITASGNISSSGYISASGDIFAAGDIYADKIRRASDSGTTTKILLNDEHIKFHAGDSSNETFGIQNQMTTLTGNVTCSGHISSSGNVYSSNHEVLCTQSFKYVDLDDGYYGMPGNSGVAGATWGFQKTNGANGLANGGQHVGIVMPYKAILVGVIGQFRVSITGNTSWEDSGGGPFNFSLWTCAVGDGEGVTATTWAETIKTADVSIAANKGTYTYNFEKLDGTTAFVKGTSIVPSFLNESGEDNMDVFGNYTIVIQRVI